MKISREIMRWKDGKMFHFLFMYTVYQRKNENFYRNQWLDKYKYTKYKYNDFVLY